VNGGVDQIGDGAQPESDHAADSGAAALLAEVVAEQGAHVGAIRLADITW
jgi:hypothetical protein